MTESLICRAAPTDGGKKRKKKKKMERLKENLGLFFKDWIFQALGEMKLFSRPMCGIITPLTLSIILIQSERSLQRLLVRLPSSHMHIRNGRWLTDGNLNQLQDFKTSTRYKPNFFTVRCQITRQLASWRHEPRLRFHASMLTLWNEQSWRYHVTLIAAFAPSVPEIKSNPCSEFKWLAG